MIDALRMIWLYTEQVGAHGVILLCIGTMIFLAAVALWGLLNWSRDPGETLAASYPKEDE